MRRRAADQEVGAVINTKVNMTEIKAMKRNIKVIKGMKKKDLIIKPSKNEIEILHMKDLTDTNTQTSHKAREMIIKRVGHLGLIVHQERVKCLKNLQWLKVKFQRLESMETQ